MKNYKERINTIVITCSIVWGICILWMGLELLIYGVIQDKLVDNIVMILMTPFIYWAVIYFKKKKIKNENTNESVG